MKRWTKTVLLSTLACAAIFGLSGCGGDKYAGEWTGWNSQDPIYGGNAGPEMTYTPNFYKVTIEKNGDGYLVSSTSYQYTRNLKGTVTREDPVALDYYYTLQATPTLEKSSIAIKGNTIAQFNDGWNTAKLSYVEKDNTILYSKDNKVVATLKKDDKKVFEDFKTFMHNGLTELAKSPKDPRCSADNLLVGWNRSITPKSINFDDSAYDTSSKGK